MVADVDVVDCIAVVSRIKDTKNAMILPANDQWLLQYTPSMLTMVDAGILAWRRVDDAVHVSLTADGLARARVCVELHGARRALTITGAEVTQMTRYQLLVSLVAAG